MKTKTLYIDRSQNKLLRLAAYPEYDLDYINETVLDGINLELADDENLLICTKAFETLANKRYKNITVQKMPNILLEIREFSRDNYDLNVIVSDGEGLKNNPGKKIYANFG